VARVGEDRGGAGLGSWLEGPRAAAERAGIDLGYPGERLGLPEAGSGSVARFGSRLLAFLLDSVACWLIAVALLQDSAWVTPVFLLEAFLGTWFGGATFGQRLLRLHIARLDGRPVGAARALLRTALLALFVPALVWDRDGRGLHDRAAGTVILRG
jgi:uncharacterized RDD family membrane protein YckC